MSGVHVSEARELLDWELSLDSRDIRAHAWYHGAISRQRAESLLLNNGDFLVRDCSSSGRPGDFVLSCRWDDMNLHFLVHREMMQQDTIYEKLRYRFESDSFDTVPDLITYHVGGSVAISAGSGALITSPRNRTSPLCRLGPKNHVLDGMRSDYASLCRAEPVAVSAFVEKVSTLERVKQKSLNLSPPMGLLEELTFIPEKIASRISDVSNGNYIAEGKSKGTSGSNFNLDVFESILLPANGEGIHLNAEFAKTVCTALLEASDRSVALHITKVDWNILMGYSEEESKNLSNDSGNEDDHIVRNLYDRVLNDSQHRWNNVIERSLSMSHFVTAIVLKSQRPESMINKWIGIAEELKSAVGNFFSFCSIMRGLLRPQITRSDGRINWLLLRQEYTTAAFSFETGLRGAYQGLVRGTDPYPPNTTIPELFLTTVILEDCIEIMPLSCIAAEDDQLELYCRHLKAIRSLSSWADIQRRNLERQLTESAPPDIILEDIFRTQLHLVFLWGHEYPGKSLKDRCAQMDNLS